ncbi:MAG: glutamate--tRNA ligase [Planctomycetes bacterium]|nr:glutamate--tRNA ligase [Planctomycetota bacterium]
MSEQPPRVRIAPSPTGDPHVGTAYVALFNSTFARANGGTFLLRIDDTDRTRYRADSERAIMESLRWLGIRWDEGPDVGGPHAPYRQSERGDIYRRRAEEMVARGAAYRCFCTAERLERMRAAQRADKRFAGYDRACRGLSAAEVERLRAEGKPHVIRLLVPLDGSTAVHDELHGQIVVANAEIDDQVLFKSDGFPTYHLANCADDIAMGITHVIRAEEWIISTPKHVLIYRALGAPLPRFYHVPLLRNADKSKISKRKNPVSLDYYRRQGYLPEALLNFLANMGWASPEGKEIFDREHFARHFRPEDIHLGGPVFDLEKLRWMNGVYIRALPPAELVERLRSEGFLPAAADAASVGRVLPLVAERLHLLSEFEELTRFYFAEPGAIAVAELGPLKGGAAGCARLLAEAGAALARVGRWEGGEIEPVLETARAALAASKPELFMPLRLALTGRKDSPPILEVMQVLGKDKVLARLALAARSLAEPSS